MPRLPELSRDGWLLFAACAVRAFAYGFLSVVLGLYLAAVGLGTQAIGLLFTIALAGAAAMTLLLTAVADQLGRRRVLVVGSALMALAGAVFALTNNVVLLVAAAIVGTINPSTREAGPLPSLEQATLPETTSEESRTTVFAAYNLVRALASAFGALAAGLPAILGLAPLAGYQTLIWCYAAAGLLLLAVFSRLSPAVEALRPHDADSPTGRLGPTSQDRRVGRPSAPALGPASPRRPLGGLHRSRGVVARLAALFALDAFGGGFIVESLVALWFNQRFGVDLAGLGAIFFGANLLSALSFLAAAPLARRIGLLNTMVFTHLPSNILLLLVPLMPSLELAVAMLLARHLLSQLDVPTRQSYTVAVVDPDERSAAAGLTSVARSAAAAVAPAVAGPTLAPAALTLGLPFLIAGGLKIAYDLAILALFRKVRPPEEAVLRP
jgi:MFS family permease